MTRVVTLTTSGASDSVLVPNHKGENWIAAITGSGDWSGGTITLQASIDDSEWFTANNVSGAVTFTEPGAVLVTAGLYYRISLDSYNTDISLTIKPN